MLAFRGDLGWAARDSSGSPKFIDVCIKKRSSGEGVHCCRSSTPAGLLPVTALHLPIEIPTLVPFFPI